MATKVKWEWKVSIDELVTFLEDKGHIPKGSNVYPNLKFGEDSMGGTKVTLTGLTFRKTENE